MTDHHSTHNPHGGKPTIMENVKITMTYIPAIETENIETKDDKKEENPNGQHLHHNNDKEKEEVVDGEHQKEDRTTNLAQEQDKQEILNGITGRSTIYLLKPCHCTKDLISQLKRFSNNNNNDTIYI